MWNRLKAMKKSKKKINWNAWATKNRGKEIIKEVEKVSSMWVEEEPILIETRNRNKTCLDEPIITEELDRAFKNGKAEVTPDKDGIEYKMIKKLPSKFKKILLKIFNIILGKEELPKQWKDYSVFFIDKPGKEKVRPIAISSCLRKTFERIINNTLI